MFQMLGLGSTLLLLLLFVRVSGQYTLPENYDNEAKSSSEQCLTKGCLLSVGAFLDNMDTTVDPCEDFYEYSCGGFSEYTLLTADNPSVSVSTIRRDQHMAEAKDLLDDVRKLDEPETFWKVKDFYYACMNSSRSEQLHSIQEILHTFQDWPLVERHFWNPRHFHWFHLFAKMSKYGLTGGFVDFDVLPSSVDDTSFPGSDPVKSAFMSVRPTGSQVALLAASVTNETSTSYKYITPEIAYDEISMDDLSDINEESKQPTLKTFLLDVVQSLGGVKDNETKREVEETIEFALSMNEFKDGVDSDNTEEQLTVGQLQIRVPEVRWKTLLTKVYGRHIGDDDDTVVVVKNVKWISKMAELLASSDRRLVANYMLLELVYQMFIDGLFTSDVSAYLRNEVNRLTGKGKLKTPPIHDLVYCLEHTSNLFEHALAALHARRYFSLAYKNPVEKMESMIREELKKVISHSDHLLGESLSKLLQESLTMQNLPTFIGFYNKYFSNDALEEMYGRVAIKRNDHLSNILRMKRFQRTRKFHPARVHPELHSWTVNKLGETEVSFINKLIAVPVSTLRGSFYRPDRPSYLNYGSLGFSIGQGLAGFAVGAALSGRNETGRKVLEDGFKCREGELEFLVKQDAKLSYLLNSTEVLEDFTRTSLGLVVARRAYEKSKLKSDKPEPSLPTMEATANQLFFISFANTLCHTYEDTAITENPSSSNVFLPGKIRVNAAVRSSTEFNRAFNCEADAPMNPKLKCSVF